MLEEYDNWWQQGRNGDQDMENTHKESWEKVIELMDEEDIKGKCILDFGCNQGGFLRKLYNIVPFKKAYGIDLAKRAIEVAKERGANYPINYVHTGASTCLNQVFNTVISTSVLYLIEDLEKHFREIASVLEKNGVYYATFTDQSNNPSVDYMKKKIDQFGATKMQNNSLNEVVDHLLSQGFSVELYKEQTEPMYSVSQYKDFFLSVEDYILSCEQSYLIKATKIGGNV